MIKNKQLDNLQSALVVNLPYVINHVPIIDGNRIYWIKSGMLNSYPSNDYYHKIPTNLYLTHYYITLGITNYEYGYK